MATVHVLSEDRSCYVELCRGGIGENVTSTLLPGLRIEVGALFLPTG